MTHLTNYGQKAYFWTFVDIFTRSYVSAGRRDLKVSVDSAGRRLSKNRKFQLKYILSFLKIEFLN
jgi:hypothetical protein